jgi:BASS family bile acid:Na+ symporter
VKTAMQAFDQVQLSFNPQAQEVLKYVLGFITFGMALDLRWADFRGIAKEPKAVLVGALGQLLLFPFLTFVFIWVLAQFPATRLPYSMALGMVLVAACPGGNISNVLAHYAGGNTPLSISLSALSSVLAVLMTPLNFAFWAGLLPYGTAQIQSLSLSFPEVLRSVFILLGLPIVLGLSLGHWFPRLANRAKKPMKWLSLAFFGILVLGALAANWTQFQRFIADIVLIVAVHNALGLALGFYAARWAGLDFRNQKTIAIEVGIQNSGLGLILFLEHFPPGFGGAGLVAAWWGIWHIVSGLFLVRRWTGSGSLV